MIRKIRRENEEEIQHLERNINRCEETISRLKGQKMTFSSSHLINRNKTDIDKFKSKIQELTTIIEEIDSGIYEEKLKVELENNRKLIESKTKASQKKKADKHNLINPVQQKKQTHYFENNKSSNIDRDERFYLKDCHSLPEHLRDRLKNMTNDVGFIWKDIWCMGELPSKNKNPKPITLHERKDGKMLIHIYGYDKYSLYEKDNTGKRYLIRETKL